jgi:hypothetical protein
MAKRPTRTQADDDNGPSPRKRTRSQTSRELGSSAVVNREPDTLKIGDEGQARPGGSSDTLGGGAQVPQAQQVQQAPGDAIAGRAELGTAAGAAASQTIESPEPSEEDIRVRAYHMYLERGGGHGADFEDWLRAREELLLRKK